MNIYTQSHLVVKVKCHFKCPYHHGNTFSPVIDNRWVFKISIIWVKLWFFGGRSENW